MKRVRYAEKCESCKKKRPAKSGVDSTKHLHLTACKVQKVFVGAVTFRNVKTGEIAALCDECKQKVVTGFSSGGMYA